MVDFSAIIETYHKGIDMMNAILGGAIIGIAVSLMLFLNGRVTGISGIVAGIISPKKGDMIWRVFFLTGLILGGFILRIFYAQSFEQISNAKTIDYVIAGLLVGFGTIMSGGCTSGHGVCGISRLSLRSILATVTFIFFGIVSVQVFKLVRGAL